MSKSYIKDIPPVIWKKEGKRYVCETPLGKGVVERNGSMPWYSWAFFFHGKSAWYDNGSIHFVKFSSVSSRVDKLAWAKRSVLNEYANQIRLRAIDKLDKMEILSK